jgi:hypothetical protein
MFFARWVFPRDAKTPGTTIEALPYRNIEFLLRDSAIPTGRGYHIV